MKTYETNMETTYRCNVHIGDRFEDGAWYADVTGNTYAHRSELRKAGFKWNSDEKKWWKYIATCSVPEDIKRSQKKAYVEQIHASGLTYPRYRPKCERANCDEEKKEGLSICSTCDYKDKCRGGLPCNGWMSNKCHYGKQLTMQGQTFCSHCEVDVIEWCKLDVFKNDYS